MQWIAFGEGCRLAKWGAVVEILAVAYQFVLLELALLAPSDSRVVVVVLNDMGLLFMLLFVLPLLLGTGMMVLGRWRMLGVPADTGAGGALFGPAALTGLRWVLLFAAMILMVVALSNPRSLNSTQMFAAGLGSLLAAWALGTFTELTAVAGIAVVGGAMANAELRFAAARASFIHQILVVVFVLLALGAYATDLEQTVARPRTPARPAAMAVFWAVVFVLQIVFTYSQYTLYAAGERAGRLGRDAV